MWSFSLEGAAADAPTPLFCCGLAHRAFLWLFVVGWLIGHITQQHCRRHDVLARSRETTDGLLKLFVSDDLPMYLSSPSADTSTRRVRQVLLEDLFKQNKALAIVVKLCLELS